MTFKEALKKWNGGIWRGAPARLVRETGLSKGYISAVITGRQHPGEVAIKKIVGAMASAGFSEQQISGLFQRGNDVEKLREEIRFVANQVEHLRGLVENLTHLRGSLPGTKGGPGSK